MLTTEQLISVRSALIEAQFVLDRELVHLDEGHEDDQEQDEIDARVAQRDVQRAIDMIDTDPDVLALLVTDLRR
jgi:hypothetical protein